MEKVKTRRNPVKMDWTWRYWWEHMVSNIYRNRDVNGGGGGEGRKVHSIHVFPSSVH